MSEFDYEAKVISTDVNNSMQTIYSEMKKDRMGNENSRAYEAPIHGEKSTDEYLSFSVRSDWEIKYIKENK